jgi:type I restriction-modification system DNA methylase subunit
MQGGRRAANIFWVPKEARWAHLKANAPQPTIGKLVDDAMAAIERDNPSLKGVLPKDFARPGLDKQRLGQIINLVSGIAMGSAADRAKDTLGRVYEYFLARFASAEGKSGGHLSRLAWGWPSFPRRRESSDVPRYSGFCKAAKLDDIRKHGYVLTPGRYVGAEAAEDDGEPFGEKMKRLTATLREQQAEAAKLDAAIAANLKALGYGG